MNDLGKEGGGGATRIIIFFGCYFCYDDVMQLHKRHHHIMSSSFLLFLGAFAFTTEKNRSRTFSFQLWTLAACQPIFIIIPVVVQCNDIPLMSHGRGTMNIFMHFPIWKSFIPFLSPLANPSRPIQLEMERHTCGMWAFRSHTKGCFIANNQRKNLETSS